MEIRCLQLNNQTNNKMNIRKKVFKIQQNIQQEMLQELPILNLLHYQQEQEFLYCILEKALEKDFYA